MKIVVTGSREWPLSKISVVTRHINKAFGDSEEKILMHGCCPVGTDIDRTPYKGVDGIVDVYGRLRGWDVRHFPPDPSKGPSRFAIRNQQMIDGRPDKVLAFFNSQSGNRGTQMTYDMAMEANLYVVRIRI